MLHTIVKTLRETQGAHGWIVRQVENNSTQSYLIGAERECSRRVHSERYQVTVMNDHPARDGSGSARGEAEATILPADLPELESKLAELVFTAGLTDNRPYDLPGPAQYASVATADPTILADPSAVADQVTGELLLALKGEAAVRLSSAEVFVEGSQITLHNSAGATGSQRTTDLVVEMVLLASGKDNEMESNVMLRRRRAADLNTAAVVQRHAQYARDALVARTPRTGTFPVVVSNEALAELLMGEGDSPLVLRSSAQAKYQQVSPWELGQRVLPEPLSGDPIVIHSNALVDYGTRSGSFDHEGHAGGRTLILDNGMLRSFWGPMRYAQYLGIPSTGEFGNLELAPGSQPLSSLLSDTGTFYHVVSFSAMSPDPITADFVGEIRLGYEVTNGVATPIRGGSIGGNLLAALATATLSSETALLAGYYGPLAARFESITVAGA